MAKFKDSEFYEQETIIGIGGVLSTQTEKSKREDAYNRLMYSREAQSGQDSVLTGRVIGVEVTPYFVAAILTYRGFKIMIEDCEFMDFPEWNPAQYPYESEKKLHEVFMNSCIGAEVDFALLPKRKVQGKTVDTISLEENIAWCSRKNAMVRRYREMWCKHRDGKRFITEGRAVEARIVRVGKSTVFFESNGVEFKMPLEELSWSRMDDARKYFSPGSKQIVRITKIEYAEDEDTTKPKVIASLKAMKEDPKDLWCRTFNEGEIYLATIAQQHGQSFFCTVQSDAGEANGAVVMCAAAKNITRYPMSGDECTIVIKLIDAKKKLIFGKIIDLSPRTFI